MSGSTIRAKEDDPEAQWSFPRKEDDLTDWERRQIIARTAEIGVRAIFENFTYRWGVRSTNSQVVDQLAAE